MPSPTMIATLLVLVYFLGLPAFSQTKQAPTAKWAIAVHGGAGATEWEHMNAHTAATYHASLERAFKTGAEKLRNGGRALDAIEAAIQVLEDDPLFNAGRGAAFNAEGKNEMDASLMDGVTL